MLPFYNHVHSYLVNEVTIITISILAYHTFSLTRKNLTTVNGFQDSPGMDIGLKPSVALSPYSMWRYFMALGTECSGPQETTPPPGTWVGVVGVQEHLQCVSHMICGRLTSQQISFFADSVSGQTNTKATLIEAKMERKIDRLCGEKKQRQNQLA